MGVKEERNVMNVPIGGQEGNDERYSKHEGGVQTEM